MVRANQAQVIRAATFHETQITRVIDNAGKVGVFVVDANGLVVTAVANFPVECVAHRHGTSFWIACSQCRPSNCCTTSWVTSISSRQRALTSTLSGSERGT